MSWKQSLTPGGTGLGSESRVTFITLKQGGVMLAKLGMEILGSIFCVPISYDGGFLISKTICIILIMVKKNEI